jgi:hypothetical protein
LNQLERVGIRLPPDTAFVLRVNGSDVNFVPMADGCRGSGRVRRSTAPASAADLSVAIERTVDR